ncbi:MAG: sigma-54-dependent transcriptional regulator [Myxococcota bacterium]
MNRRRSDRFVGTSRAMQRALEQVTVAGRGRFPVWIQAEDGIDKELMARLIHSASEWATGGFFGLDASIVPESLLGRELFGSVAGAIAALPGTYEGAFERVGAGTVLVERIETVPKDLQNALATALAEGSFRRIGGQELLPLEGRLIAASGVPLDVLISEGRIVRELGERLRLLELRIPPLRERKEDILPIAAQFLSLARRELENETGQPCEVRSFSREALERLVAHPWPGNERELREQVRAALRLARGEELGPEDLLLSWESSEEVPSFREAKRAFEREYVTRVLRICHGNISKAARIAKKDRKDFYDVMRRNAINPTDFRN